MTVISDVSRQNFYEEVSNLRSKLSSYRNASIDTEFPRLIHNTSRDATVLERYEDVRLNVYYSTLCQFGITLTNDEGEIGGTWQFYLYDANRMDFLRREIGIRFGYVPTDGIPSDVFSSGFIDILREFHGKVRWITFHGLYDIAHLTTLVTNEPLPPSISEFVDLVGRYLGRVYDLKWMVGPDDNSKIVRDNIQLLSSLKLMLGNSNYLGLDKLAGVLGVKRDVGRAHQAGSDSLVTASISNRLNNIYRLYMPHGNERDLEGFLYGLSSHRVTPHARRSDSHDSSLPTLMAMIISCIYQRDVTRQLGLPFVYTNYNC